MPNVFNTVSDSFYVNLRVGTQMALPHQRETLLHFFEQIQKGFPEMSRFRRSEQHEYTIEEDRDRDSYRWLSIDPTRVMCGHVNPNDIDESLRLHRMVLQQAPHALGLSMVELEYMDLLFGFDLEYGGNHDEIVAECLFADSPLAAFLEEPGATPIDFQPSVTISLSEDDQTQARIEVLTRSNHNAGRSGEQSGDVISVHLIVRRFWGERVKEPIENLLGTLADHAETLAHRYVVPRIVQPMKEAIGSRS
ncbi:MAG TPA: hypothetical protein VGB55_03345 [Tepidisphaeraceae bacterium]|jgi:hypothetical protein